MITRIKIRTGPNCQGFTLVEAMLSIMIVGIGIVSLMMLFASGTTVNKFGNDLSTAVFLADQMRNMTDEIPFNNLLVYNNQTFNGVDAGGNQVAGMQEYHQQLKVQPVNPDDLTVYVGADVQAVENL